MGHCPSSPKVVVPVASSAPDRMIPAQRERRPFRFIKDQDSSRGSWKTSSAHTLGGKSPANLAVTCENSKLVSILVLSTTGFKPSVRGTGLQSVSELNLADDSLRG